MSEKITITVSVNDDLLGDYADECRADYIENVQKVFVDYPEFEVEFDASLQQYSHKCTTHNADEYDAGLVQALLEDAWGKIYT
jgi:hypothetical protein